MPLRPKRLKSRHCGIADAEALMFLSDEESIRINAFGPLELCMLRLAAFPEVFVN